jgi:cell division protein FtsI (penicillin-binding protein 3)
MPDDSPSENTADLTAMFDEINNLPADDPLRTSSNSAVNSAAAQAAVAPKPGPSPAPLAAGRASRLLDLLPARVVAAFAESGGTSSAMPDSASTSAPLRAPPVVPQAQPRGNGAIVVDAGQRVPVPSFAGAALRKVIETSAGIGLRVEPVGSGIARDQAPAAGTMVPVGTEVVVRFAR